MKSYGIRLVRELHKRQIPPEEQRRDHEKLINEFLLSKKLRGHTAGSIYKARATVNAFFIGVNGLAWQ